MILTLDLGTTVAKAALWGEAGLVALAGAPVTTTHPAPGRSEQQPPDWWSAVADACTELRARAPEAFGSVDVVGCTGARQSLALVGADGAPIGPAILWSDRRAAREAAELRRSLGAAGAGSPFGITVDAGSVAAKIAWLARHEPGRLRAAAWILSPRDLVAWWLTGTVASDPTMAWRTGLYDEDGRVDAERCGPAVGKLAPVCPSDEVTGRVRASGAAALGLRTGTPVVIGAGDRACEVLGSGADGARPMVSWGTTANVSMPVDARPGRSPSGLVVSRSASAGWLLEGGLSGAGSAVAWMAGLTGRRPEELARLAADSPPGACGATATPWLDGARAPWWRDDARGALVGLSASHGPADLARAVFESVAWDVQRCLETMQHPIDPASPVGSASPVGLCLGGAGASIPVWLEVLSGITGLPLTGRRSGQAASAGAALLAAVAVGLPWTLDGLDPVARRFEVDPAVAADYRGLRAAADRVARAVIDFGVGLPAPPPEPPCG